MSVSLSTRSRCQSSRTLLFISLHTYFIALLHISLSHLSLPSLPLPFFLSLSRLSSPSHRSLSLSSFSHPTFYFPYISPTLSHLSLSLSPSKKVVLAHLTVEVVFVRRLRSGITMDSRSFYKGTRASELRQSRAPREKARPMCSEKEARAGLKPRSIPLLCGIYICFYFSIYSYLNSLFLFLSLLILFPFSHL